MCVCIIWYLYSVCVSVWQGVNLGIQNMGIQTGKWPVTKEIIFSLRNDTYLKKKIHQGDKELTVLQEWQGFDYPLSPWATSSPFTWLLCNNI